MRIVNLLLLIATIIGAVLTLRQYQLNEPQRIEREKLIADVGWMKLENPLGYQVLALTSDEPRVFRWRVFWPEGGQVYQSNAIGSQHYTYGEMCRFKAEDLDRIVQVRFQTQGDELDELIVYFDDQQHEGTRTIAKGREEVDFFSKHWDELEFKILGDGGVFEYPASAPLPLLEIHLPDELLDELNSKITSPKERMREPLVYRFTMGTQKAVEGQFGKERDGWPARKKQ